MEPQRLSKIMSQRGLCSRREADRFIEQGWVKVDGEVVNTLGLKVLPNVEIELRSKARGAQAEAVTILLNKPIAYVSGQAEHDHLAAISLIRPENFAGKRQAGKKPYVEWKGLAPAGRLDIDSQGLLVLTKDGRIAKQLVGEHSDIEKEYLVWLDQPLEGAQIARLQHGLELDDKPLKPAKVKQMDAQHIQMILTEGKKRQVRRMCELVGAKVVRLMRVRIGQVRLGDLPAGKWRYLLPDETF